MALFTTGLIENKEVFGIRASSELYVRITNTEAVSATLQIKGHYLNGTTMTEYVFDLITLSPGEVVAKTYYALFDAFEFRFTTSVDAVEISVWGKDVTGKSVAYCVVPTDLFPTSAGVSQIYVANSCGNKVSVIDEKTNALIGNVSIDSEPFGIDVNPETNRIYVANAVSNNVTVIDGSNNTIIATVAVNINPEGIGVNPVTNKIYVANKGSNNVSVIDGFTHVIIASIVVGSSPVGVNVNPITNRIYVKNQGSNNVSVINGNTNTVIATIEL